MDSNELREHVRKLNEQERIEHILKAQAALKRIRELREQQKRREKETV